MLVRYDLDALKRSVSKEALAARDGGFWKYREFLPVRKSGHVVRLGEVATPLVDLPASARAASAKRLLVKDEGRLPTGSFKARGLALAGAPATVLGGPRMAIPTNGNAGAALAAYAAVAGIETHVFCPADTPEINVREIALAGAHVTLVDGLLNDCGRRVAEGRERMGWFDVSTLKEPYRLEGKKTMGIELAEQLGWRPARRHLTGRWRQGLIGMWKAFDESRRSVHRLEATAHVAVKHRVRADRPRVGGARDEHAEPGRSPYLAAHRVPELSAIS